MLNVKERRQIRVAFDDGLTKKELAFLFGVSEGTIYNIISEKYEAKQRQKADRMEYFLGGATINDGCYLTVPKNSESNTEATPLSSSVIDNRDPLAILLAEELANLKMDRDENT